MGEINMSNPQYGGFWIRFLATLIDVVIFGVPTFALQFGILFATGMASLSYLPGIAGLIVYIYLEGMKGGTPGKLILGLRIVNENGNYIGIPKTILRYIGKILSSIILYIGFIMIAFTAKKQGLHDMIANTYVVYK